MREIFGDCVIDGSASLSRGFSGKRAFCAQIRCGYS
jgi:hypothetical protein